MRGIVLDGWAGRWSCNCRAAMGEEVKGRRFLVVAIEVVVVVFGCMYVMGREAEAQAAARQERSSKAGEVKCQRQRPNDG